MWLKLDDGFATHPKILDAGPEALVVQIRALCYASQNRTDGLLPLRSIPLFLVGLNHEINWLEYMVDQGLWEVRNTHYYIHDYLDWNMSKSEYESFINKKRKAGKKGMQARWGKALPDITDHITPAITDDITKRYHPTSTATATLSSLSSPDQEGEKILKKRGGLSEFPEEWKLSDEEKTRASALGLNPLQEFAKFRDHHHAKGTTFKDWPAAWRNWVRRGAEMKEGK